MPRLPLAWRLVLPVALALAAVAGCAEDGADDELPWEDACVDGKCDGTGGAVPPLAAPDLLVNDLAVLGELERGGFDLASRLGGAGATTAQLAASSPAYRQLAATIAADLAEFAAADRAAGVGLGFAHRLFDARWLSAAGAAFQLVAVVNRIDRVAHTPGACGEVRLVYRLGYASPKGSSRLPMTLMVVHEQPRPAGGCAEVARAWQGRTGTAAALAQGPLAGLGAPRRLELNLQAVRWPAGARADMGGHAEYLMRVFALAGDALAPLPLSNTIRPDLTAAEKASLAAWITANVAAIDAGTAEVPAAFLATKAISVSPRGLARGANRPFLLAFPRPEVTFAGVAFAGRALVTSPGGLVRRLDTLSCQGCHQSRGLAGFHVLGQDDPATPRANAIEVGTSPHLHEELAWRQEVLASLARGAAPATPRPFAERNAAVPGTYGAHCGLGDPSFASWTCAPGFTCKDINGDEVGMCVPAAVASAGDACETSSVTLEADPHADRVVDMAAQRCTVPSGAAARCSRSSASGSVGGFPNGSCTASCRTMGATGGAAICGAMPPSGFNECLASGGTFAACLEDATPAFRRRCDARTPCGDDYVCAGVAGAPRGVGACMPPYFIFQARVDGHPAP